MSLGRRFDPAELVDPGIGSPPTDAELGAAAAVGRELEARRGGADARPSADFTDRVMAAIAAEPPPLGASLWPRRLSPAGILVSIREAWATAIGDATRPIGVRAAALAYVLVAVVGFTAIGGAAAIGAAGALGVFDVPTSADPSPKPPSLLPSPSIPPPSPEPSRSLPPSPSRSPEPSESVEPSQAPSAAPPSTSPSPGETEEPDASGDATSSPTSDPSDAPESSDDHSGSSPDPSETPKPSGPDDSG